MVDCARALSSKKHNQNTLKIRNRFPNFQVTVFEVKAFRLWDVNAFYETSGGVRLKGLPVPRGES